MSEINTVLGLIPPEELGVTLYHEHLAMKPGNESEYNKYTFDNPNLIINELIEFKKAGGGTFVEMTPINFGRDIEALQRISKITGVHVICCTGFHKKQFLPEWVNTKDKSEIVSGLIKEITSGINGTDIRAGVIKIGTSKEEIFPLEKEIIQIVAEVHKKTNVPISTHCDKGLLAVQQGKLFVTYGVEPDRVVFGHVDIPNDVDYLVYLCESGFNVGIDHIGRDLVDQDQVKIEMIKVLIAKGFIDKIFIAGDMGKKDYLHAYGGKPGFDYILKDFFEYFLKSGLSKKQFLQILVENPKRFFQM